MEKEGGTVKLWWC